MSGIFDGPATGVTGGNFVVTTAGTQLQLTATPTPCVWVKITAAPANTGGIVVGDADVDGTADAESGITVAKGTTETFHVSDASLLWVDAPNSGDEFGYLIGNVGL